MFPILAAEVAQAPPSMVIENPEWTAKPTGADVARYYPERAQRRNIEGRATLVCQVAAAGALANCIVVDESPVGENFGTAVLHLSQLFRMEATGPDGSSTAGHWVKLPMAFRLPRGSAENTAEFLGAEACYGQVVNLADGASVTTEMWQASLYWYAKIAQSVANIGGRPAQVENYAVGARLAAEQGRLRIPKGWDLQACLAKTAK